MRTQTRRLALAGVVLAAAGAAGYYMYAGDEPLHGEGPETNTLGSSARERARTTGERAVRTQGNPVAKDGSIPGRKAPDAQRASVMLAAGGTMMDGVGDAARPRDASGRKRFEAGVANPVRVVTEQPVSTFSLDVDTSAYTFTRARLNEGVLPPRDVVRTEEFVNYFPYGYAPPKGEEPPFAVHATLVPNPWREGSDLLHIGIKGHTAAREDAPPANLVFLVDTSGSMAQIDKLPLLVHSLTLLLDALDEEDRVGIVTYAGGAGVALEPTRVAERGKIVAALERLRAGGGTAGAAGVREAYRLAGAHARAGGVNRVILATDGDFNIGVSDPDGLEALIARKRENGVGLSVLGFGRGNYNDAAMQRLAQHGDGNAAYIDSLSEARKVLLEEAASTLVTIARDVKVQVEFNPAQVSEYRLIGYETRVLAREDFRNDKVDAGEVGAGHTVTTLYELTRAGSGAEQIDPLRYGAAEVGTEREPMHAGEVALVKLRYKRPGETRSRLMSEVVEASGRIARMDEAHEDVRFASAVAAFAELLRGGRYTGAYSFEDVAALAEGARGDDPFGYRSELVRLARLAGDLKRARR